MGNLLCIGLNLAFLCTPTPLGHVSDNRLPALVNMDVLDSDLLLTLPTMLVQGF